MRLNQLNRIGNSVRLLKDLKHPIIRRSVIDLIRCTSRGNLCEKCPFQLAELKKKNNNFKAIFPKFCFVFPFRHLNIFKLIFNVSVIQIKKTLRFDLKTVRLKFHFALKRTSLF